MLILQQDYDTDERINVPLAMRFGTNEMGFRSFDSGAFFYNTVNNWGLRYAADYFSALDTSAVNDRTIPDVGLVKRLAGGGGGGTPQQIHAFLEPVTDEVLPIPAGAKSVYVFVQGAGGGGGAGRRGLVDTFRGGGAGGNSGAASENTFSVLDDLNGLDTLLITVGAGGVGGVQAASFEGNGLPGNNGGASIVKTGDGTAFIQANGGEGGQGGLATNAPAPTPSIVGAMHPGNQGGIGSAPNGGAGIISVFYSPALTSAGGGGGGVSVANLAGPGGAGNAANYGQYAQIPGGAVNTNGGNAALETSRKYGQGGSGGGGAATGNAGNGGNGVRGGGGGGGGGALSGNIPGAGGNGGAGYVLIIFTF
jgi:hypothetical protein